MDSYHKARLYNPSVIVNGLQVLCTPLGVHYVWLPKSSMLLSRKDLSNDNHSVGCAINVE